MKKYLSFFKLRFTMGLQYRAAALAGIATQFLWSIMEIQMFRAFYKADSASFPMTLEATCTYVWMQQAFLALFMAWFLENEIFDMITNGNIAYELCRPIHIYKMWFSRSIANRLSKAVLRSMPILLTASLLPKSFGMSLPMNLLQFLLFIVAMIMGLLVTVALCMLIYIATFFTISPAGVRMLSLSIVEFFAGSILPLPFFPDKIRKIMEFLPFASMQNVPFRIYSGDIRNLAAAEAIILQVFWLAVLVFIGDLLMKKALKKIVVQGG